MDPFTFGAVESVLEEDERIFTSMDKRPITGKRVKPLDLIAEPDLVADLHELGRRVFIEAGMETLVRLDVRADIAGNLFVLETNPKTDLSLGHGNYGLRTTSSKVRAVLIQFVF